MAELSCFNPMSDPEMQGSFWSEDSYRTHFLCALCGGPLARVRTADFARGQHRFAGKARTEEEEPPHELEGAYPVNDFSIYQPVLLPEITANFKVKSPLSLELRGATAANGPLVSTETRRAYDASKLESNDTKWIRIIRALIHRHARVHPQDGLQQLANDQSTYLTGRGRMREDASWADAYASVDSEPESEEEDEEGLPFFGRNHGFHVYQEPDRIDQKFRISSFPFHDECWDILDHAFQVCKAKRGITGELDSRSEDDDEHMDTDQLWNYLCDLLPVADTGKPSDLTTAALRRGDSFEVITRLSVSSVINGGYREAQICGEGLRWLHIDSLHWLVANPSQSPLLHLPLELQIASEKTFDQAKPLKSNTRDRFWLLPSEILVEILKYLSCVETFRWRMASVPASIMPIPQREYCRFIREEMSYLPKLLRQTEDYQTHGQPRIDWRNIFEYVSRSWKVDNGLRNRRRIWKILQPIADDLVERSSENLHVNGGMSKTMADATSIVRGTVGRLSGSDGWRETLLFVNPIRNAGADSGTSESGTENSASLSIESSSVEPLGPNELVSSIKQIRIWLDPVTRHVRGLEFSAEYKSTSYRDSTQFCKQIGVCQTLLSETYRPHPADSMVLIGFYVCWKNGSLSGIRFVFDNETNTPVEAADDEILSPPFGDWDYPVRRLVCPRKYRHLAGVTVFINSLGFIETFAIMEQRFPITFDVTDLHVTEPPVTVPLSHAEASMWKLPPPNNVLLLEREGPIMDDWRTRASEWMIRPHLNLFGQSRRTIQVRGYLKNSYLVGLSFQYSIGRGSRTDTLGFCDLKPSQSFKIPSGDDIYGAVINYGPLGVHGLQIILSSGSRSPPFGNRYLGTQSIFALERVVKLHTKRLGDLTLLKNPIIGFHCLASSEVGRIIQLGIITEPISCPEEARMESSSQLSIYPAQHNELQELRLPFVETDEQLLPWVDNPPPPNFVKGLKNSDSRKAIKIRPHAKFTGWVSFAEPVSHVIIYGKMEGIKFGYSGKRQDTVFGNTDATLAQDLQRIYNIGDRITGIAISAHGPQETSWPNQYLPNLLFLKGNQQLSENHFMEVEAKFLAGVQFTFTSERVIDWCPLIQDDSEAAKEYNLGSPYLGRPTAKADQSLLKRFYVLSDAFERESEGPLTGVKGYSLRNRICGLRFRRGDIWDDEPLGQASAFESLFLIHENEKITTIFMPEPVFGTVSAVAVSTKKDEDRSWLMKNQLGTSTGRCSPWFGSPEDGVIIEKKAPIGQTAIGIYMSYSDPSNCDRIGLIYDEIEKQSSLDSLTPPAAPNAPAELKLGADHTLTWGRDPSLIPRGFQLQDEDSPRTYYGSKPIKSFTLFEPELLQSVEAYVNDVPGRFGLQGIKFHGSPRMGTVILGDWQDRFAKNVPAQNMKINGIGGERIIAVNIGMQQRVSGNRLVEMTLETDHGQQHSIVDWRIYTQETPDEEEVSEFRLECLTNEEIVGFHYTIGSYVHHIGLITREI